MAHQLTSLHESGSKLISILSDRVSGTLDGKAFKSVSLKSVGKKAFVIKGWVSTSAGPAVRFRAPWGQLSDGEMFHQATPQNPWEDSDEESIDFDGKTLTVVFTKVDGKSSTAKFTWK